MLVGGSIIYLVCILSTGFENNKDVPPDKIYKNPILGFTYIGMVSPLLFWLGTLSISNCDKISYGINLKQRAALDKVA